MKNFFDCKDEKITEKAFSQSLIISVVSILLCLVALCSMTYAWFTSETSSGSNTLTSGSFDVYIAVSMVEDGVATVSEGAIEPVSVNEGKYIYKLEKGTYDISLELTEGSTVKGHCVVKIGNGEEQHTAAIIGEQTANVDEAEKKTDPFEFKITVTETTEVTLEPRWGVVVEPDIEQNGEYPLEEAEETTQYNVSPDTAHVYLHTDGVRPKEQGFEQNRIVSLSIWRTHEGLYSF